jgi:PAS domain S-box-containing protein
MKLQGLEAEIARRMRAEDALRETEERNRAVLGALGLHIAVLDGEGTIVLVNEAWLAFARENGITDLSCVSPGVNYLDVCRRGIGKTPEAEAALRGIQSILAGSLSEFKLEYNCHSPDEQRWFHLCATPLKTDRGRAVVCHSNETRRVLMEKRLRDSERYYRALIDHALDVVSILDRDGVMLYTSRAIERNLGFTPEEMTGQQVLEYVHPEEREQVRRALELAVRVRGSPQRVEVRIRHKDGTWRFMESVGIGHLENPFSGGIIVNSRDVTARREAEAALREKEAILERTNQELQALSARVLVTEEEERRRIARELHDDLNQNLAILAVDLSACIRQVPASAPDELRHLLRAAQNSITKLSEDVRRMAHQLHPAILDDLGLVVALRYYCREFSRRHAMNVKFVHRNVPSGLPPEVRTSLYRITQEVLWNVVRHAQTKHAVVALTGRSSGIGLRVRDRGAGFDPGSPRARCGLGLISMEERARIVGGSFAISSRPGDGTLISVQIPLKNAAV